MLRPRRRSTLRLHLSGSSPHGSEPKLTRLAPCVCRSSIQLGTEYRREFPERSAPVEHVKRRDPHLPSGPFRGTTTQRADFTPKRSGPGSPRRGARAGMPMNVPFDGTSTYRDMHTAKPLLPNSPHKKVDPAWSAPFVGLSTYNSEFISRQAAPQQPAAPAKPIFSMPFEGTSEYRQHFTQKAHIANDPRMPQQLLPSQHIDNTTTYANDFVPKPFEERVYNECCDNPRHGSLHVNSTLLASMRTGGTGGTSTGRRGQCCQGPMSSCSSCVDGGKPAMRSGSVPRRLTGAARRP